MMCVHMHVLAERLAWGVTFCGESSGQKGIRSEASTSGSQKLADGGERMI